MVDRAANQRKFLVIKRSKEMGTEVTSNGKGGFTAAGKTPVTKASLEVPPGFKEMVSPILDKAVEKLGGLSKDLAGSKAAEVDDEGSVPGIPAEFSKTLSSVIGLLDKANTLFPVAAPEAPEAGEGEAPPEDMAAPSELQMRAAMDAVGKIFGNTKLTKEAVAKVGAKMSKDRFTRLQQAAQVLTGIINELSNAPAEGAAPAAAAPDAAAKAKTAKAEGDVAQLTNTVKELTAQSLELVKTVKSQAAELASLKKSRSGGNGSTVETVTPVAKSADGDDANVSWPFDLNNPVTRDTVGKGESFFPED